MKIINIIILLLLFPFSVFSFKDETHYSKTFNETRHFRVFTPPGYDPADAAKRYPVIYYFHGCGGSYEKSGTYSYKDYGLVPPAVKNRPYDPAYEYPNNADFENFVNNHEVIIISVDGKIESLRNCGVYFPSQAESWSGNYYNFSSYIRELFEVVDASYNTKAGPQFRAVSGLSMGGQMAIWVASANPGQFSSASEFCHSPNFYDVGDPSFQTTIDVRELWRNLRGVPFRHSTNEGDYLKYYTEELYRTWLGADFENAFYMTDFCKHHAARVDLQFAFHMDHFRQPKKPLRCFSFINLYQEFEIRGYKISSSKNGNGWIYLHDVAKNGLGLYTRKQLPWGTGLSGFRISVTTPPLYFPNGIYTISRYSYKDNTFSRQKIKAGAGGKLVIRSAGGMGEEIGILGHGLQPPVFVLTDTVNENIYIDENRATTLSFDVVNLSTSAQTVNFIVSAENGELLNIVRQPNQVKIPPLSKVSIDSFAVLKGKCLPGYKNTGYIKIASSIDGIVQDREHIIQVVVKRQSHITDDIGVKIFDGRTEKLRVLSYGWREWDDPLKSDSISEGNGNGNGKAEWGEIFSIWIRTPTAFDPKDINTWHPVIPVNGKDNPDVIVEALKQHRYNTGRPIRSAQLRLTRKPTKEHPVKIPVRVEFLKVQPLKDDCHRPVADDFSYAYFDLILYENGSVGLKKNENNRTQIYKDPGFPVNDRVADLLSRMTLEEKIAQMSEASCDDLKEENQAKTTKFSFEKYKHGVGTIDGFTLSVREYASAVNKIQKYLVEETRLGIPAIFITESLHGIVQNGGTIYPQSIAMASTWDPDMVWKVACQIRKELKAIGVSQTLSPDLDLARELRWGRIEETYGEDPYLASRMGVAMIRGLQEGREPDGTLLIANAKPFLTYSSPLGGLNLASTPGGWYDLYNTYLPPFRAAIREAQVLSVMSAYNSYDGVPLNANREIYTDLLRTELGFKGYVYSDWGAVSMLQEFHKVAKTPLDAAELAIKAGIDLEAPSPWAYSHLDRLVKLGRVDLSTIDSAVARILYVKFASGLFEHPFVDKSQIDHIIHNPAHVAMSKKMADESIVLLKNENNLLPLNISTIKSIAIIGPNADQVQFGDYTWSRDNKDGITVRQGIRQVAGHDVKIHYAKGCDLTTLDGSGISKAVKAAKKSDVAILVIGTASASLARDYLNCTSGEGYDLTSLNPTGKQTELVQAVHATGKPTIVVLIQAKPFSIPWMKEHIPAIVEAWYPGEMGGLSIAEVLFGKINPGGKIPVSFPKSVGHLPCYYNYLPTDKGYYKEPGAYGHPGRDYVFSSPDPLWAFGYGLSYTTFSYDSFKIENPDLTFNDQIVVHVDIKNTGSHEGKEVVQLYIRDEYCSVVRPVKELKAFKKINLMPGETKTVKLTVNLKDCGYYDNKGNYLLEPGNFIIMVGAASDDIKFSEKVHVR